MSVTTADLQAFADAWNRHDVEALMSFMTDDCVFEASAGPDVCGTRYVGRQAVRAGFTEVWETYPDAQWRSPRHFVCADRGVSEWTYTGTRADGARVEVNGRGPRTSGAARCHGFPVTSPCPLPPRRRRSGSRPRPRRG